MTLSAAGRTIKTLAEIRAEMRAAVLAVIPQAQLGPQSALGRIIDIAATEISTVYQIVQALYQSFDPDQAFGTALENLCALTGTNRNPATNSVGVLTVTGTPATVIASGSLVRIPSGVSFETTAPVTIPGAGFIDVAAQSVDTGPVEGVAGSITEIVTIIAGWTVVTNALDFTIGTVEETDGQVEGRSERYFPVRLSVGARRYEAGELVEVKVVRNTKNGVLGRVPE